MKYNNIFWKEKNTIICHVYRSLLQSEFHQPSNTETGEMTLDPSEISDVEQLICSGLCRALFRPSLRELSTYQKQQNFLPFYCPVLWNWHRVTSEFLFLEKKKNLSCVICLWCLASAFAGVAPSPARRRRRLPPCLLVARGGPSMYQRVFGWILIIFRKKLLYVCISQVYVWKNEK